MTLEYAELGDYKIELGAELAHLSMPNAKAVSVTCSNDPNGRYFALLCGVSPLARFRGIPVQLTEKPPNALDLVAADVLRTGRDETAYAYGLLYRQPGGERLWQLGAASGEPLSAEQLRIVVKSAVTLIKSFDHLGLTHRAIRPDNLFWADESKTDVIFGDCLSAPPGYDQPIVYEPIARSMCPPAGRGEGSASTDLYALGVTLLALATGKSPFEGVSEKELTFRRLENGNYAAYTKNLTVPKHIFDLIQGLLIEDMPDRWRVEDVEQWLENKSRLLKPSRVHNKSSKPLTVGEDKANSARGVNWALKNNWQRAYELLSHGDFQYWIRQELKDQELLDRIIEAFKEAGSMKRGDPSGKTDLVCNICMVLDTKAPIHWDGFSCMVDGVGHLLAAYIVDDKDTKPIVEMIAAKIPYTWLSRQDELPDNARDLVRGFERARLFLNRDGPGFGVARAAYTLCPEMPCIASALRHHFVVEPKSFLRALENVAPAPGASWDPFDPDLVAYMATHFSFVTERELRALTEMNGRVRNLAKLTMLAFIQRQSGIKSLPRLAAWLAPVVRPCLGVYRHVETKEKLQKTFDEAVPSGDLAKLLMIVDNSVAYERDKSRFKNAVKDYQMMGIEIEKLRRQLNSPTYIHTQARQIMAKVTAGVSGIFMVIYLVIIYIM